ncbi:LIM domain only protein 7-like isoform X2 [Xiphias gladius]|uniref:LIM domain only protein 7-like isoform X2 n=1 Tax=Xiphias gladius TaxID=8245 RepID=UPI001A98E54C|nr:LIM domain only protein 7-like isoform X2 [Xiphias gladius]
MEWRQQTSLSCADAFNEAQRWIEEVTGKSFGCNDFRAALENGVLLCDLINQLKPGIIKRVNRLSTPIAGLDNVNVFLKACGKLGLNDSQLFHPGDLQDLSTRVTLRRDESNRRLKNVLITIYWLGRKAHLDAFYSGPELNFKAFEGLLGLALSKALDEGSNVFVKDSGYRECWYPEREERQRMRLSYKRVNSVDSIDSLDSRAICPNSEGCGSDAEAEQVFRMETTQPSVHQNKGNIPPPPLLRRKQGREENGRGCASPITRSKSLSDIPMVYPVRKFPNENIIPDVGRATNAARESNQENAHKSRIAAKDSEAQWQDDLTKWKNRRRSTKSDLRRKSQDREHVINQMTNGAVANLEKNDLQGGLLKRDQLSPRRHNPASGLYSTSQSKSSSSDLQPHTRALLARSYAIEAPFSPTATLSRHNSANTQGSSVGAMPASDGNILGEEIHFASLASDGEGFTTPSLDCPLSSQTHVKSQGSPAPFQTTSELAQPETVSTNQISSLVKTIQPNETTKPTSTRDPTASVSSHKELPFCVDPKAPTFFTDAVNQRAVDALEDLSHQNHKSQEESWKTSWEPAVEQGRGQQAAGIYKRLSRTGSWSSSASLPRGYRRSEGSSRVSSAITARPFGTKQSRVSSLPRLCNVDDNQGLLFNSEREEFLSPPNKSLLKRQTATGHLRGQYQASVRQKKANMAKQNGTEQAEEGKGVSLSSQTTFQTNGYHHQPYTQTQLLPQPYSTLLSHHSKSSTLQPSKLVHSDMRVSLTLKPNSRPDFGFQTHWDSTGARVKSIQPGSPAELCQLHVDDEIVTVDGVAVAHMNYNQWKHEMTSALQTGSLTMDIRRYGNKDWSTSEGSHHSQPGQSKMTLNLTAAAPVLIGFPDHHANSATSKETTVTKTSNVNGQADLVIQGKVMDGGLADRHRTARSKGGSESAISDLQVPSVSPSSSSWSWDREDDRRRQEKWQEEQERLLQEQYQRDQERLEAEWRRAQQDAIGDLCRKPGNTFQMTIRDENPASTQRHANALADETRDEQSPDGYELKEAGSKPQIKAQGVQKDKITERDWALESCGFAQLSPAHRAKSLSTPALTGPQKQTRGDQRKRKGQSVSKVEQERQQILEEMKKRTQLLTDNSWIRQRSSSFYKEPIYVGVPLKRYESLDNLDTLRQSPVSTATFGYPRPHSAAAGYCAPSRNSSSRYSTGSVLSQRYASMDSPHHGRMVSGRRTCCVCERVLGSGAAMVVEALSLCFHLACFQCVGCHRHLGGTETGVQVRIQNRKPHCELCYFQIKYTGAPSM